jgi:hypothetical protein
MADHKVNCNPVTEPTVLLASAYSPSSAHSCYDDSNLYEKRYRSGSALDSTLSPGPSPALNTSCSVRRRSMMQNSDEDATAQSPDSAIMSPTRYSGMSFAEFPHEGQTQDNDYQIVFPPTSNLRREHPCLESPILSQENHVSPLLFNAEMLQLLHLSQSNAIPGQKRVGRSQGQVSAPMPVNRQLST